MWLVFGVDEACVKLLPPADSLWSSCIDSCYTLLWYVVVCWAELNVSIRGWSVLSWTLPSETSELSPCLCCKNRVTMYLKSFFSSGGFYWLLMHIFLSCCVIICFFYFEMFHYYCCCLYCLFSYVQTARSNHILWSYNCSNNCSLVNHMTKTQNSRKSWRWSPILATLAYVASRTIILTQWFTDMRRKLPSTKRCSRKIVEQKIQYLLAHLHWNRMALL